MPTETEKYESSVYQTPELNPSLSESHKQLPTNGSQPTSAVIKRLEYDSGLRRQDDQMSTMTKAMPGGLDRMHESGSEENIADSNDSEDQEDYDVLKASKNPFAEARDSEVSSNKLLNLNRLTFGGGSLQPSSSQKGQVHVSEDFALCDIRNSDASDSLLDK